MKTFKNSLFFTAAFLLLCLNISGCGGESSGVTSKPTRANTLLKTSGLVPGYLVGAIDIQISIPYGVTVACVPGTNEPVATVVQLIGTADTTMLLKAMNYTPATAAAPGLLAVQFYNANGFSPGESLLIQLDVTNGYFPQNADFTLTKFDVAPMSADGQSILPAEPVLNPVFTVSVL